MFSSIKKIHFVGIAGIGMSGIAESFSTRGLRSADLIGPCPKSPSDSRAWVPRSLRVTVLLMSVPMWMSLSIHPLWGLIIQTIVHKHRGTIDKYIGDAVMAFWNAPLDMPNHAEAAVQTALDMQAALPALNEQFAARNWPHVKIGVGVNSGRMSVGNMGSSFRMSYTVMGDAVNLGSRLEGITKQYGVGILATQTTVDADARHVFMKIDDVRVKGKEQPVAIYDPLGVKDAIDPAELDRAQRFEEAFAAYQHQRWDEAETLLTALNTESPRALYDIYLERIAHFRAAPPPENWDGVFVYTTK